MTAKATKRVTFVLHGYFDIGDGVSVKDAMEAMNEIHEKVSENGAVESFTADLPSDTITIDGN